MIIKVITLPNSCYTVLYWSRTLSLLLYYILLVIAIKFTEVACKIGTVGMRIKLVILYGLRLTDKGKTTLRNTLLG